MAFVDGYITVMNRESLPIKKLMVAHLQDLMEDGEMYWWLALRAYHAAWLQYMEQGRAAWGDEETKLKLQWRLVWHWVVPVRYSEAPSQGHPPQTRLPGTNPSIRGLVLNDSSKPGDKVCDGFNKGKCASNADHPSFLHVCSYCLYTVQHLCYHTEQYCCRKAQPKNGAGGIYH